MIKKYWAFIFTATVLVMAASCARVQTLNLVKHNYSNRPYHIIWVQLAGLTDEHIALLKFNNTSETNYRTGFENFDCMGKVWNYNLYDLRPESSNSFLSQINGSKNIKAQCDDFSVKPVWEYLSELGYVASILENGASDEQSLERALKCKENATIDLSKLRYYRMGPENIEGQVAQKSFHYQDSENGIFEKLTPGIYYDKSCQKNICYSSVLNNFKTLWSEIVKNQYKTFFLIRDFSFLKGLKKKDIALAKESLQEIERLLGWIHAQKRSDVLLLVTGAESLNIELPKEGKEWAEFERSAKNVIYRNSSLMSGVMAKGPMSENFCGLYDESEIMKRLLYQPPTKVFSWDLLNPFSD